MNIQYVQYAVLIKFFFFQQFEVMNDHYVNMNEQRFKNETDYLQMFSSPTYVNMGVKETDGGEEKVCCCSFYIPLHSKNYIYTFVFLIICNK